MNNPGSNGSFQQKEKKLDIDGPGAHYKPAQCFTTSEYWIQKVLCLREDLSAYILFNTNIIDTFARLDPHLL